VETLAPEDKALYKTVAGNCKNAIDKFHAAKELALVRKNNLCSFFSVLLTTGENPMSLLLV